MQPPCGLVFISFNWKKIITSASGNKIKSDELIDKIVHVSANYKAD